MARPYLVGLFAASIIVLAWLYRHLPAATSELEALPEKPELRLPLVRLALAAIAIAAVVIVVGIPEKNPWGVLVLLIGFVPVVLPTALIYFVPLLSGALFMKGRMVAGAVAGIIAILPFAHWAYAHFEAAGAKAAAERRTAELPRAQIESYPTVLVVEGSSEMPPGAWTVPGLSRVITGEAPSFRATDFENGARIEERAKLDALPADYLLIRMSRAATSQEADTMYMYDTPYELSVVRSGTEYPVAQTVKIVGEAPAQLPILMDRGWMRESRIQRSDEQDAFGKAFFAHALGNAKPET